MSDNGRLDEKALRKPGFVEGESVVLADGQAWHIPRPTVWFVPSDSGPGFEVRPDFGPEYQELIDDLISAPVGFAAISAELAIARFLLLRNYDLTLPQVQSLIRFRYAPGQDEDEAKAAIIAVAMGGIAPKRTDPSPGGSTSPS
jgi:hypothetical protein